MPASLTRKLGQMLAEGREAGDIAGEGRRPTIGDTDSCTLADLGIQPDYAATVARFASIPDDVWGAHSDVGAESRRVGHPSWCRTTVSPRGSTTHSSAWKRHG